MNLTLSMVTLVFMELNKFEVAMSNCEWVIVFLLLMHKFNRWFFKNRCEILKTVHSGYRNVNSSQANWYLVNQVGKVTGFQEVKSVIWVTLPLLSWEQSWRWVNERGIFDTTHVQWNHQCPGSVIFVILI